MAYINVKIFVFVQLLTKTKFERYYPGNQKKHGLTEGEST